MCPSGATCLTTDGCFGELARKFTYSKRTSLSSHQNATCSRHDADEKLITEKQLLTPLIRAKVLCTHAITNLNMY